ncbi:hypothetical protein OIV83_006361 [Microbotryomycetes sp. JL201]|nr:hypothetical protein OIV83_006361 [Microbotryomycetes sp. JL201]
MILRRIARMMRIGKERFYVGSDLEGNSFYEWPSPNDPKDWRHAKRVVEYAEERPLSDYQFVSIPVQWSSWMRRTRQHPPSIEELKVDAARQARLADNVEQLRLAYAEEKQRLKGERDNLLAKPTTGQAEIESESRAESPSSGPGSSSTGDPASSGGLGDERVAQMAQEERERERQLLRQKKEEFARAHPTFGVHKGNPSDTFQPEAWNPKAAKPKPRK